MNISKINPQINFQKTLCAKAKVLKDNKPYDVNIYKLDNKNDDVEFVRAKNNPLWARDYYLKELWADFCCFVDDGLEFYEMESDDLHQPICFVESIPDLEHQNVTYIETAPQLSTYNKQNRKYKYIGQTMLSFFAGLCQRNIQDLKICDVEDREDTKKFYFSLCGMEELPPNNAILRYEKLDAFVNSNAKNTGSEIEYVV